MAVIVNAVRFELFLLDLLDLIQFNSIDDLLHLGAIIILLATLRDERIGRMK